MTDSGCVLAVDAGGTFLKAALAKNGALLPGSFFKVPVGSDGTAGEIRGAYLSLARLGREKADALGLRLDSIGVCIPGPFDYHNGVSLMTHKYAAIRGMSLRDWLREGAGDNLPVTFLHDSHAFLLGALAQAGAAGLRRAAGVTIGTGLGFASFLDGALFKNPQGGPGISIFARPFRDGINEDYASRRAVLAYYQAQGGVLSPSEDVAEIAIRARGGEPAAQRAFDLLGEALGQLLRPILLENRFQALFLGGAISKSAELFLPALRKELEDLPDLEQVAPAPDIDNAPLLGTSSAGGNDTQ